MKTNFAYLGKWGNSVLFVLAIVSLAFLGWASRFVVARPYEGIDLKLTTGLVTTVDPLGPAAGLLQAGDIIVAVGERPLLQAGPLYAGLRPGEPVNFTVRRAESTFSTTIYLAVLPLSIVFQRLEPFCIALAFWAIGIAVLAFKPTGEQARLLFLICQTGSGVLVSGSLSVIGPLWAASLFNLLQWWVGPLAVHFHAYFPDSRPLPKQRLLLVILYGVAVLGSVPHLVWGTATLRASAWYPVFHTTARLNLALNLIIAIALLWRAYRRAVSPRSRQQIRLVALGGIMALMPLVGLGLLPDAVLRRPLVPYEVAFLFLLAIPLAYGYAIVRYKLIQLDRYINRSVAYTSVFMLLASLYVALNIGLERLLPGYLADHPLTNALLVLAVAITFTPLYRRLQKLVDWAFYGGSYDYRTAVERITQGLDRVTDATMLTQLLTHRLQTVMGAKCAHLLLPTLNPDGELWLYGVPCQACANLEPMQTTPPALRKTGVISQYLRRQSNPVDAAKLRRALAGAPLAEAERQLLNCEQARLWVPLMGNNELLGVLILGPKRGSEVFDASDLSVLDVVARQVLVAIKNIQLAGELQRRAAEVERLHRRVMRAREEERKQLARELHDQIIQTLVGLNYKLARFDNSQSAELRDQVRSVMGDLRRMCRELRPPVLDNLGLVPAVRSHLRELENQDSLKTELAIEGDEEQSLPEDVALCLFRTLQEALVNVQKHAAANRAVINLTLQPQEISLSVQDDGQGFIVPSPLSQLLDDNHFGLVGLRERLDLVNGKLEITSVPGQGTRLLARVPLY